MTRFALLIEASKSGTPALPGCVRDVERLKGWLESTAGGAWNDDEIKILNSPSSSAIAPWHAKAGKADFAFVAFSGHGRILEDRWGTRTQKITVGSSEEIDFMALRTASTKTILICDACREVERVSVFNERVEKSLKFARAREFYTRQQYRDAFEYAVKNAPAGAFCMYSCSPGQTAGEDALNGGYFTDSLISGSGAWWEQNAKSEILTIDAALGIATQRLSYARRAQVPMGGPESRSGNPFPFAVCLK